MKIYAELNGDIKKYEIKSSYDNILKSFLLGMILLIKGLITEYGQFATVATKKDQAEIVIKEIKKLLDCSIDEVKNRYKIYGKAKIAKIVCEHSQAEIFPLSSDANTLDGLGIDTCVCDEFGAEWIGSICSNTYLVVG